MRKLSPAAALCFAGAVLLAGCRFGRVNQGQVVEYDKQQGLVTLIPDSNYREPGNPRFDVLPPVVVRVPADPGEMGPEPEPGRLLQIDWRARRVVVFDRQTRTFLTIPYTLVNQSDNVGPSDARVAKKRFPLIDRAAKTITVYSPYDRKLAVFSAPDEYLGLPADTWRFGDEIRYYYKDPHRALRLMNVTKTDLTVAGK
jgi:hypothetical protein